MENVENSPPLSTLAAAMSNDELLEMYEKVSGTLHAFRSGFVPWIAEAEELNAILIHTLRPELHRRMSRLGNEKVKVNKEAS
jgi:hypothetical protein